MSPLPAILYLAMGCGRLFEGTPEQMWESLQKMLAWPDETKIYCGHEYTLNNGRFALSVDPDNDVLKERVEQVKQTREAGKPTLPTTLAEERATNPFLRPDAAGIRKTLDMNNAPPVEVFARIRALKDLF
ncbi:MAG: hydroxyacylglutathione hydrolase C-terminal domain-containing protein [Gammaproteobacteria bacterium]|nr:hydroxyacylglutathione hydrolase C-terminal domain-containing protein [Gammaproteobacteria bacterium]